MSKFTRVQIKVFKFARFEIKMFKFKFKNVQVHTCQERLEILKNICIEDGIQSAEIADIWNHAFRSPGPFFLIRKSKSAAAPGIYYILKA